MVSKAKANGDVAGAAKAIPVTSPFNSVPSWLLYTRRQRWRLLAILFLVATSSSLDRYIVSILVEPIKQEFAISDAMLGLFGGFAFTLCYATFAIPVARWADRGNRRTVITLALTAWSAMTVLCGFAQSFWQLLLARVGVGIGESGASPAAQSLIIDYFPPESRATAIAIFIAATAAGLILGFGLGGYLADEYSWRVAFVAAGAPGLALALLARFGLAEPRLQLGFPGLTSRTESLGEVLARLWAKPSYRYAVCGSMLYAFIAAGSLIFWSSFMVRILRVPLRDVGIVYGPVAAAAVIIGTLGGGWLGDRLRQKDIRWVAWLPAAVCTLVCPIYIIELNMNRFLHFLALDFVANVLLAGALPLMYSTVHTVCGNRRRAMAIAIVYFASALFGAGLGPLLAGALSDMLSAAYGVEGLRYALVWFMSPLFVVGVLFYLCARAMPRDLEN